ncbi:MAG: sigma-54 dependent transcriptional regulator [Planctomycetes bacterium]|nr:sigma-54 dependent transcriptional regulator [Planctomycetota bacterium]
MASSEETLPAVILEETDSATDRESAQRVDEVPVVSKNPAAILVVDDDVNHAMSTADVLRAVGYECEVAHDGEDGLKKLKSRQYDLVITDLVLGDLDGLQLLRHAQQINPFVAVIVFTGHATIETAVEALKRGAADYLIKPLNIEGLRIRVQKALERQELVRINLDLERRLDSKFGFEGIIGNSEPMRQIIDLTKQVADTDVSVLITGENGTGKELIARAIHENSRRKKRPLVPLNCAALSSQLVESELFGHEKGSFTGAHFQKKGRFEFANNGTLFLDEVGEIPLETQVKLLRVLEDGEITRVGSNESINVNVRLISATNRDLEELIAENKFREDLYYRLKVVTIHLPPLRERVQDIALLVDHFIREFARIYEKPISGLAREALNVLSAYRWPGNVRELKHAMEHMVVVSRGPVLGLENLPTSIHRSEPQSPGGMPSFVGMSLQDVEKELIKLTLEQVGGNRHEAAKILGIGERTLYRKLKLYDLS